MYKATFLENISECFSIEPWGFWHQT